MAGKGPSISATQAWLAGLGALDIRAPLVDNMPLGDFWVRKSFFMSVPNAPINIPIKLPRLPSFFFWEDDNGAVVYATHADRALWTPSNIVLRSTVSTTADLIIG